MNIGILTIGDELTGGRIQNTNAAWIADRINRQGWHVHAMLAVGDEEDAIEQAVAYFPGRCDAVLVTGGLGPTPDDITAEAIAKACGLILARNDQVLTAMQNRFAAHSIHWRESHARMSLLPEGAEVIPNPVGSAWGFSLMHRGCLFVVLPGVPGEATRMVTDSVIPLLKSHVQTTPEAMVSRTLKCCGITESDLEEKIRGLMPKERGVRIGFYPMFPEVHLVLTVRHSSGKIAEEVLDQAEAAVAAVLAPYLFGRDDETMEGVVGTLLKAKGLTLSVAESCTGGLIADRLTDVSGSSLYVECGVVTYSNAAKIDLLQVPEAVLVEFGAVSEPTARLMAEGVRKNAGVDIGISTTGIAGPTGAVPGKPAGTVFIAVAGPAGTVCRRYLFHRDRRKVKVAAACTALMLLREYVLSLP